MIIHETEDLVAIATSKSSNRKTGKGVQIWILPREVSPHISRETGHDRTLQCKGCPLASYQGCYVASHTLQSVWNAYRRGAYGYATIGTAAFERLFRGKYVRYGAYGNPSMLPLPLVREIADLARRHTGYFHDWHLMPAKRAQSYGQYFMASTEPGNRDRAKSLGLRTFTTRPTGADSATPGDGEILCPAVHPDPKRRLTCAQCGLCNGNARGRVLPDVVIPVHGYQVRKAAAAIA